jgi:hypothetical protein
MISLQFMKGAKRLSNLGQNRMKRLLVPVPGMETMEISAGRLIEQLYDLNVKSIQLSRFGWVSVAEGLRLFLRSHADEYPGSPGTS